MTPREKIAYKTANEWCDNYAPDASDFARRLLIDIMLDLMDRPRNKECERNR